MSAPEQGEWDRDLFGPPLRRRRSEPSRVWPPNPWDAPDPRDTPSGEAEWIDRKLKERELRERER